MFHSLFSDRYNNKREIYYRRYESARARFPNLPLYRRPVEPTNRKLPKRGRQRSRHSDYDYDEWIAGNFVSIVVRRELEQWSCCQLMEPAPSDVHDAACSWRAWAREEAAEGAAEREPRRSQRLTDKPNFKLKDIANSDTNVAIKWQQQHPLESPRIRQQEMPIDGSSSSSEGDDLSNLQQVQPVQQQCNMCGSHYDGTKHSLDECRKYLLATLDNCRANNYLC